MQEYCVTEKKGIYLYFANSDEILQKFVGRLEELDKDKVESENEYNKRIEREKFDQLRGMQLHGEFGRGTGNEKIRTILEMAKT